MPLPGERSMSRVPGKISPPLPIGTRSQRKRRREDDIPEEHNHTKPPLHPSSLKRKISEPELELPRHDSSTSLASSSSAVSGRSSPSTLSQYMERIATPVMPSENEEWGIYDERFYGGKKTRRRRTKKRAKRRPATKRLRRKKTRATRSKKSKMGGRRLSRRRR